MIKIFLSLFSWKKYLRGPDFPIYNILHKLIRISILEELIRIPKKGLPGVVEEFPSSLRDAPRLQS